MNKKFYTVRYDVRKKRTRKTEPLTPVWVWKIKHKDKGVK